MPVFLVVICNVAKFCINLCVLARPNGICHTISMTHFNRQTSVTELTVPTTFTVIRLTTWIGDQDVVAAICYFELHGTSRTLADMPRQTNAIVKSTGTKLFITGYCGTCGNRRQTHCRCRYGHCCCHNRSKHLLTEFVFQHRYPP